MGELAARLGRRTTDHGGDRGEVDRGRGTARRVRARRRRKLRRRRGCARGRSDPCPGAGSGAREGLTGGRARDAGGGAAVISILVAAAVGFGRDAARHARRDPRVPRVGVGTADPRGRATHPSGEDGDPRRWADMRSSPVCVWATSRHGSRRSGSPSRDRAGVRDGGVRGRRVPRRLHEGAPAAFARSHEGAEVRWHRARVPRIRPPRHARRQPRDQHPPLVHPPVVDRARRLVLSLGVPRAQRFVERREPDGWAGRPRSRLVHHGVQRLRVHLLLAVPPHVRARAGCARVLLGEWRRSARRGDRRRRDDGRRDRVPLVERRARPHLHGRHGLARARRARSGRWRS